MTSARRRPPLRLRELGEHRWIARLLRTNQPAPGVLVGPGDDAAAIRAPRGPLLLTTDALVEGVHFERGWESPEALGRRALRVSLSDIAAMGGRPLAVLVAVEAPPDLPVAILDGIARGVHGDARRWGADVVGGNLAAARRLALTVTVVGAAVGPPVTRDGGYAGDDVWITGTLGGSGTAVRALRARRRARRPPVPVRLAAARILAPAVHAMIDVSDGLVQDLGHICRASAVAADVVASALPIAAACRRALGRDAARFAATAGEDYELLVTASPARRGRLERLASRLGCRFTRIGRIRAGRPGVCLLDVQGRPLPLGRTGFDHFR